jgi:hypothetical protein
MKQVNNDNHDGIAKSKSPLTGLLGKRHEYSELSQASLGQIAERIGFSTDEISELERLYVRRFKKMEL